MKARALSICLTGVAATVLAACGGSSFARTALPPAARHGAASSPIEHVVIVVQENRSFDDFFATFPGAHGATRGKGKTKRHGHYVDKWITLQPHPLLMGNDLQHCRASYLNDYDGGKMDGFNLEGKGVCGSRGIPAGHEPYQYVQQSDIQPYWDIANRWILADETFQTQGSGSFTAHQDLIRGGTCFTPAPSCNIASPSPSTLSLVDNPMNFPWGCDAPPPTKTHTLDIYGNEQDNGPFPCTNKFPDYGSSGYETLRDLLDARGVSWKYYTPCFNSADQKKCTPSSDCGPRGECAAGSLDAFEVIAPVRYGPQWGTNVVWPQTKVLKDAAHGKLPDVSWVIPTDADSDHPGESCHCDDGPSWVASVVNAVGESPDWKSSVIVVVWDDWGGFYDNAAPPIQDKWGGLGFRVPMLILSPYAIAGSGTAGGYISHTQYEFGSILKYIEQNWNLGSLGTTDTRANSIGDVLDYTQKPRTFVAIKSKKDARYFLNAPLTRQHGDPE